MKVEQGRRLRVGLRSWGRVSDDIGAVRLFKRWKEVDKVFRRVRRGFAFCILVLVHNQGGTVLGEFGDGNKQARYPGTEDL
jgi:hypothetical protein